MSHTPYNFYAFAGGDADDRSRAPNLAPIVSITTEVEVAECPAGCPALPQTSYWLGRSNEMARIKNILIIVNTARVNAFNGQQVYAPKRRIGLRDGENKAKRRQFADTFR
jgi:hypothetical protein